MIEILRQEIAYNKWLTVGATSQRAKDYFRGKIFGLELALAIMELDKPCNG